MKANNATRDWLARDRRVSQSFFMQHDGDKKKRRIFAAMILL